MSYQLITQLREAAKVIPDKTSTRGWDTGDWADYHYALAKFWRLAAKFARDKYGSGLVTYIDNYDDIITEVEKAHGE